MGEGRIGTRCSMNLKTERKMEWEKREIVGKKHSLKWCASVRGVFSKYESNKKALGS